MHPLSRKAVELRGALDALGCKWCNKCQRTQHRSHFAIESRRRDGLQVYCAECARVMAREHHRKNSSKRTEQHRRWVAANRDKNTAMQRAYKSRPDVKAKHAARAAKARATISGGLRNRIATRIHACLKRGAKGGERTEALVGWTIAELRTHLERQFLPSMSWQNMGEWHIDHIVPLSSFAITAADCPELKRAWALTNLRPLWAKDNIKKGARRVSLL